MRHTEHLQNGLMLSGDFDLPKCLPGWQSGKSDFEMSACNPFSFISPFPFTLLLIRSVVREFVTEVALLIHTTAKSKVLNYDKVLNYGNIHGLSFTY